MALTTANVRDAVEAAVDWDEAALQRILDGATEAVNRAAGKTTAVTETHQAIGAQFISLSRRSTSIDAIRERRTDTSDQDTLASNDWRKFGDYQIQRLQGGTNSATTWGAQVEVDYTPEVDTNLRERVILNLCEMDVEFKALESSEAGDVKQSRRDYKKRRSALLKQVREGRSIAL